MLPLQFGPYAGDKRIPHTHTHKRHLSSSRHCASSFTGSGSPCLHIKLCHWQNVVGILVDRAALLHQGSQDGTLPAQIFPCNFLFYSSVCPVYAKSLV